MTGEPEFHAWNPGLSSRLPAAARPLVTIFNDANCRIPLPLIDERSDFCGIGSEDLAILKPERLALHELLIRVTGDFSVPDGKVTADLGINFRKITDAIWQHAIQPHLGEIAKSYEDLETELRSEIDQELERLFVPPTPPHAPPKAGFWAKLFGWPSPPAPDISPADPANAALQFWRAEYRQSNDRRRQRVCRALARVTNNIMIRHGRLLGDREVLRALALGLVMNDHGSVTIGQMIRPWIMECAASLGLRLLPAQAAPVILNTKGASAAGKSTLRPRQHELADRIGVDWADFAIISPDIWRKYLLDYESLGDLYKYAGMCTGEEIRIIDQKLDRYIAGKAAKGWRSHLLIDRFRFDSFAEDEEMGLRPKLLTRFGDIIYFFFVITPPHETVPRAWYRGLEFGRFKAVDDLLAHNVEAFSGMPDLFMNWATHPSKKVYFEFLDNSVPAGETPKTVAFGTNDEITILDLKCLIDADRYRKINIAAKQSDEVYLTGEAMAPEHNLAFINRLKREISTVNIVDPASGEICLTIEHGRPSAAQPTAALLTASEGDVHCALASLITTCDLAELREIQGTKAANTAMTLGQLPTALRS